MSDWRIATKELVFGVAPAPRTNKGIDAVPNARSSELWDESDGQEFTSVR